MKEVRGPEDRYVLEAHKRIIDLYEARGNPNKAAEYRAMLPDSADVPESETP